MYEPLKNKTCKKCRTLIAEPKELIRIVKGFFYMTIDDELLLELIKPDSLGEVGEGALIVSVVGTKKVKYKLEQSEIDYEFYWDVLALAKRNVEMTPDITIDIIDENKQIAIELENDYNWGFQKSLRQVKKYRVRFDDTRVIIPEDYGKFAPLYKHEGFRVYLWKAIRRWQCLKCGTETTKEGRVIPKCSNQKCGNHNQAEFRLIGLKDTTIEEF